MKFKHVIFDLDGTLIKSDAGIFYTLEKVFDKFGVTPPPKSEWLNKFIGPSLNDIFTSVGIIKDQITPAIKFYQKLYAEEGMFHSTLYDGILDLLIDLKNSGTRVYMATAKNVSAANDVAKHFGIDNYFDFIAGSSDDQTVSEKPQIIENLLKDANVGDLSTCVMVGDKKYDIDGARENAIGAIGVIYGYGLKKELNGSDYVVETVSELKELLLGK